MTLPQGFQDRMTRDLGEEAPAFFHSLTLSPRRSLRMNPALLTKELLFSQLGEEAKPLPFGKNAYYFTKDGIGKLPLHHSGAVYVQEPAAMAPVFALPEGKHRLILDLCAAPGGKSLQAARLLSEDGILVSNEPVANRRRVLMQNIERLGEKRALVTGFDATRLPSSFRGKFSLVIVDAPCSGEGMMRKNEEAVLMWSQELIAECAARQKEILESAAEALLPGGLLLYATCTWAKEENEEQIAAFLARHPDFSPVAPKKEVADVACEGAIPHTLRFYPHRFEGEGQFLAILQKGGQESEPSLTREAKKKKGKEKKPLQEEKIVWDFLGSVLKSLPKGSLCFREDSVFLLLDMPFSADDFVSPGVLIGSVQKGRVVPHHRFFRAFAGEMKNQFVIPLDDPRTDAYLRGEEIALTGEGYGVLFAHTLPLGGVKATGGRGKNLYPKGLREP